MPQYKVSQERFQHHPKLLRMNLQSPHKYALSIKEILSNMFSPSSKSLSSLFLKSSKTFSNMSSLHCKLPHVCLYHYHKNFVLKPKPF